MFLALLLLSSSISFTSVDANQFDPYQLNGGLVSAVAGRDYVILAADTRMIGPGGYDILERHHTASRIWSPTDALRLLVAADDDNETAESDDDSQKNNEKNASPFAPDGSLAIPLDTTPQKESLTWHSKRTFLPRRQPPVLIGSAGCNADCEMLKRVVRSDLRAAHYFCETRLQPSQVATLLMQILYSRRGFPYYAFCIVAGVETETSIDGATNDDDGGDMMGDDSGNGGGHVYVYDAIGSYERVAVATTGTGRELLQPILDRKFRSRAMDEDAGSSSSSSMVAGGGGGSLQQKRMQEFGRIPVAQVSCSKEEALSILVEGYRAVAEREIGVGDQVAFCVLAQNESDGTWECQVCTAPLKKH